MQAVWELLIVDDSPLDTMILISHLGELPFRVHQAGTMAEAYEMMCDKHIDLCILDLGLPDVPVDGSKLEALKQVRRFAPDLPVLVISGNDGEGFAEELGKLGGEDWIPKDRVSRENLRRILYTMTGKIIHRRQMEKVQVAMHKTHSMLDIVDEVLGGMVRKVAPHGG